jgi:hypothetical protein
VSRFAAETGELLLQSVGAAVLHYPLYVPPEGRKAAIDARTGDTVLVVGYLGEDIWLIRYRGVEREAGRFWASDSKAARPDLPGELVRPLRGQCWVRARNKEGLLGWLQAGEVSGGEGADGAISTAAVEGGDTCG